MKHLKHPETLVVFQTFIRFYLTFRDTETLKHHFWEIVVRMEKKYIVYVYNNIFFIYMCRFYVFGVSVFQR